jgi:hypothetical protein
MKTLIKASKPDGFFGTTKNMRIEMDYEYGRWIKVTQDRGISGDKPSGSARSLLLAVMKITIIIIIGYISLNNAFATLSWVIWGLKE